MTTPAKIAADAMIKLVGFMLSPKIFFQTSEQFPVRTKFNVLPPPPGWPLRLFCSRLSSAWAEDPAEAGEGGGATASAAQIPDICKAQAAKRSLTGSEAEEYLKQCAAPVGDAEKSAAPADRLEGQL